MPTNRLDPIAAAAALLIASACPSQCPPASTYYGFHLEGVGSALSSHGDEALFGHSDDPNCGMFRRRGNDTWSRIALLGGGGSGGVAMGRAVDLVADVAMLGDPVDTSLPGHGTFNPNGAAVVYERSGTTWSRVADLYPPTPSTVLGFGGAVALSQDGLRAAVLSHASGSGRIHLFERLATGWAPDQIVNVPAAPSALAIANDVVFVGTPGGASGEVHTFARQAGGWTAGAVLAPPTLTPGAAFGWALARDGDRIAIGAPSHTHTTTGATGAVYVYDMSQSNWQAQPRLVKPWTQATFTQMGLAVDVVGDRLAIGARGHALEFRYDGAIAWWQPFFVTTPPTTGFSFDFGESVAIYSDGMLVGDSYADDDPWQYPDGTGGVHAYDLTDVGKPLLGCARGIAVESGGTVTFAVRWPSHAGENYQVFGSFSGLGPTPAAGLTLPLSIDGYTSLLLSSGNTYLTHATGVLDAIGRAQLEWRVPNGLPPWLAGLQFHHALVTFAPGPLAVSNAITTSLANY